MQKSLESNCLGFAIVSALALSCLFGNAVAGGPANDQCVNAISIGPGSITFDTTGATTDGPPSVACQDGSPDQQVNQDIWFNYMTTGTGILTVSLCGSNFNTKIAVYDGCTCINGNLNLLACDDNTCGQQSQVQLVTNAGGCYQIRVGGFGSATGSGTLTLEQQTEKKDPPPVCPSENECCTGAVSAGCNNPACCTAVCEFDPFCCETLWDGLCAAQAQNTPECGCVVPANDNCADAILVDDGELDFSTISANTDGPPHSSCAWVGQGDQIASDIWFEYIAPSTAARIVSLCAETNFDSRLAVYEGCDCNVSDATLLACDDDGCVSGAPSIVELTMLACQCYTIRVGGQTSYEGTGILSISTLETPGDVNGDGGVDVLDLLQVISHWGPCEACDPCSAADENGDGVVGIADLLFVIAHWGS